jgi:5-hydroxyisourate hydrolase
MSPITTHVLDIAQGRSAEGIVVVLEQCGSNDNWSELARGTTNADGRISALLPDETALTPGIYRLRFATGGYFASFGVRSFYPEVQVVFHMDDAGCHYHVPLLLSPYGYSTYRGS